MVVLGGVLLAGVRLMVGPSYTEMQAINGRFDRMEGEIKAGWEETTALRGAMRNKFKTARTHMAVLGESLTRMQTLVERWGRVRPPGTAKMILDFYLRTPRA